MRAVVDQLHQVQMRDQEQLRAHVYRGRQLAHAIKGDLAIVFGVLSLLGEADTLTPDQRGEVTEALARMGTLVANVDALHALVKTLAPESAQ